MQHLFIYPSIYDTVHNDKWRSKQTKEYCEGEEGKLIPAKTEKIILIFNINMRIHSEDVCWSCGWFSKPRMKEELARGCCLVFITIPLEAPGVWIWENSWRLQMDGFPLWIITASCEPNTVSANVSVE